MNVAMKNRIGTHSCLITTLCYPHLPSYLYNRVKARKVITWWSTLQNAEMTNLERLVKERVAKQ